MIFRLCYSMKSEKAVSLFEKIKPEVLDALFKELSFGIKGIH